MKMKMLIHLRRYYGDWKRKDGSSGAEGREERSLGKSLHPNR